MAAIGTNTLPIKYKKSKYFVIGVNMAITVPSTHIIIDAVFSLTFLFIFVKLTPAEYASRNVVVTVDSNTIAKAATPSPAFNKICAISDEPANIAAPSPIIYIQQLPVKVARTLAMAAPFGFLA